MAELFYTGQRWTSEGEPELGLGCVQAQSARTVTLHFSATGETREYAKAQAPLRRVRFHAGDRITLQDGWTGLVQSVTERAGCLWYATEDGEVPESKLSGSLRFSRPQERLLAGQLDAPKAFDLRRRAWEHQHRIRKSPIRGFLGGRIDLLPHQLSIAADVTERLLPRVLLADEVGLGKTIEACLILHRLLLTGRAERVLILVPDSLVHQWFVELLRRFSLWFAIFDRERCEALEAEQPGANPFLEDQRVLCSLAFLMGDPRRLEQALTAGWDLLIVDEAHHLGWSPEGVSPEYTGVEALSRRIPGLLLLTATPEQLGRASHFARLRLLDPDRFFDLEAYLQEAEGYAEVARLAEALAVGRELEAKARAELGARVALSEPELKLRLAKPEGREALLGQLMDQHGTGRVMFRNTRATLQGFPARRVHLAPLVAEAEAHLRLRREWAAEVEGVSDRGLNLEGDPRLDWLVELLHRLGEAKVLLLCCSRRKVEALQAALRQGVTVKAALFHEGLSLVQRDRNAAWFAEPQGARLLLCSEIGSEGRNFQFAQHLVLFDLPLDPSLLEQRIGRLDRIGQVAEIQIHVPYLLGSPQEGLVRWMHEGLDVLTANCPGGRELLERFGPRLRAWAQEEGSTAALETLIADTRAARIELGARLEQGRDRLLERNSFRPGRAEGLIRDIRAEDEARSLEQFLLAVLEHAFIEVEEVAPRSYQLGSAGVLVQAFPGLPAEGLTVTCDRARALLREDLHFLTWDHPLVAGAFDLLLGSEQGNCSFALWPDTKQEGLFLEALFVLECLAPPALQVDRFLPPTPLRVLVDALGRDGSALIPAGPLSRRLKPGEGQALVARPELREKVLPKLIQRAESLAKAQVAALLEAAQEAMRGQLEPELARLRHLRRRNPSIREEEIRALEAQCEALAQHLGAASLRLDAVRLIRRG